MSDLSGLHKNVKLKCITSYSTFSLVHKRPFYLPPGTKHHLSPTNEHLLWALYPAMQGKQFIELDMWPDKITEQEILTTLHLKNMGTRTFGYATLMEVDWCKPTWTCIYIYDLLLTHISSVHITSKQNDRRKQFVWAFIWSWLISYWSVLKVNQPYPINRQLHLTYKLSPS